MSSRLMWSAALAVVAFGAWSAPASARITALPNVDSQFREGATDLARAIAANPRHVRRGSFSLLPPGGRPVALSTTRLGEFPRRGRSYAILSTGDARQVARRNNQADFGRGNGGPFLRGARDVLIYRIDLRVPRGVNCLSFRFKFLTEEFPEFVNEQFNDAFIAEIGASTWNAASNQDPTITAPDNFAQDARGNLISVNGAGDTSLDADNSRGTVFDGGTRVLRASAPIRPGSRQLYLSIFDQGDRSFDSAVFIDNLTLDDRESCNTGAVVD